MSYKKSLEEGIRLVGAADELGLTLRLIGSLGASVKAKSDTCLKQRGTRTDVDVAARSEERRQIEDFLGEQGYRLGGRRAFYLRRGRDIYHGTGGMVLDVFFDELPMNHSVPFRERIDVDYPTLAAAELVLQYLQREGFCWFERCLMLEVFRACEVSENDRGINVGVVANRLGNDWGFYHTASKHLAGLRNEVATKPVENKVRRRISALEEFVEESPKSCRWHARRVIGSRKRWYSYVDETGD